MSLIYGDNVVKVHVYNEIGERHKAPHIHIYADSKEIDLSLDNPAAMLGKINGTFSGKVAKLVRMIVFGYLDEIKKAIDEVNSGREPAMLDVIRLDSGKGVKNSIAQRAKSNLKIARMSESVGSPRRLLEAIPFADYTMELRYSDGAVRWCDFSPILERCVWAEPLRNLDYYLEAQVDISLHNVVFWGNYNIEIGADDLFAHSRPV